MPGLTTAELFASASSGVVVAPAGCGKTELIARCLPHCTGRQLVLTHTHAGVRALRQRLRSKEVPPTTYRIDTIAGFALRYAAAFATTSGLPTTTPTGGEWATVYKACESLLAVSPVQEILKSSYTGVIVDEYQDCSVAQHRLVLTLASHLPVRIVGDPVQAIFDFKEDPIVDWTDVERQFPKLDEMTTPHRWTDANPELGKWLTVARESLRNAESLSLDGPFEVMHPATQAKKILALRNAGRRTGSVAGIQRWPKNAHDVASKLGGQYSSMEEMEAKDLLTAAVAMDSARGVDLARAVMEFAVRCMTGVRAKLGRAGASIDSGYVPKPARGKAKECVEHLREIASTECLAHGIDSVVPSLEAIRALDGVKLYRRELFDEMKRACRVFASGGHESLVEAAWATRDAARHRDRRLPTRLVSRTLLVKGLEFDHCVVLDADEHDAKSLYVSLTRGSATLTVLASGGLWSPRGDSLKRNNA